MTFTSFWQLMSNASAALSLINGVLAATVSGFSPLVNVEQFDWWILNSRTLPEGIDFHGETPDGRDVIVEVDTQWAYVVPESGMFSGAAPLADADFGGRWTEEGRDQPAWIAKVRDAYTIRIFDYDLRLSEPEFEGHFRVRDVVSDDRWVRIHVIDIDLPLIKNRFPVADEIAMGWASGEWWYYVLQFSNRFTESELRRCRDLGMNEGVVNGLATLNLESWEEATRSEHERQVRIQDSDRAMLHDVWEDAKERGRREGRLEGYPVGLLRGMAKGIRTEPLRLLILDFLETGSLYQRFVKAVEVPFPEDVVRRAWDERDMSIESSESYEGFIAALRRAGLIAK
jgi:hypothetical protein